MLLDFGEEIEILLDELKHIMTTNAKTHNEFFESRVNITVFHVVLSFHIWCFHRLSSLRTRNEIDTSFICDSADIQTVKTSENNIKLCMYCDLLLKPRLKVLVEDIKIVLRIMLEVLYDTSNQFIDCIHCIFSFLLNFSDYFRLEVYYTIQLMSTDNFKQTVCKTA